jgi:predicted DNA-binding transcriptional regulator AlpA
LYLWVTANAPQLEFQTVTKQRQAAKKPKSRPKKPFPPLPPAIPAERPVPDLPFRIMTTKEVCAMLGGISVVTLWDWIRKGHFPPARVIGPNNNHRTKQGWLSTEVHAHIAKAPTRRLKAPEAKR